MSMKKFNGNKSKAYQEIVSFMNGRKPDFNDKLKIGRRLTYYIDLTVCDSSHSFESSITLEKLKEKCKERNYKIVDRLTNTGQGIGFLINDEIDTVMFNV